MYICIYILNSWRGEQLVKTQIFPTSFDLAVFHEGYCFQFDYLYKLYLTSNDLVSNVTIGCYVVG